MTIRVAINGFGRIGRLVLRAAFENNRQDIEIVAVNGRGTAQSAAYLLAYDSVHGRFPFPVHLDEENGAAALQIQHQHIPLFFESDPLNLPWKKLNVDVVLECSGAFTTKDLASHHIRAGAEKVLLSAPGKDVDLTVVYGVNHQKLLSHHRIVSNASCTTNCLAPLVATLHSQWGILKGYMTAVHAYTGDQSLVDHHHQDVRRGRAANLSLVPSTTGAARSVGAVFPELEGKLDGTSIRVPAANVSLVDLTFLAACPISVEAIHHSIEKACQGPLKGVMEMNTLPLVSCDFNHQSASCIFDATQTQIIQKDLCRVLAWYDNEWGFSNRMLDVAACMGTVKKQQALG